MAWREDSEARSGPKNLGQKKALLSSRRAASLLYTPSINGGASVAGQSGTVWAGLASINPSQPVPHCCPSWPEPRTLTRGGEGVVEHSAGELGGCKHWDHPVTVYTPLIPPDPSSRPPPFHIPPQVCDLPRRWLGTPLRNSLWRKN